MCMDKVKDWLFGEEEGYTEDYNTAQNGQEQKSNIFETNSSSPLKCSNIFHKKSISVC